MIDQATRIRLASIDRMTLKVSTLSSLKIGYEKTELSQTLTYATRHLTAAARNDGSTAGWYPAVWAAAARCRPSQGLGFHNFPTHMFFIIAVLRILQVKPPTASKGPYASPPLNLTDIGVRVWFRWSDWSICSRCDRIGKRIRFGICMVTSFEVNNRSGTVNLKSLRPCPIDNSVVGING